jgi:hypothetical protein
MLYTLTQDQTEAILKGLHTSCIRTTTLAVRDPNDTLACRLEADAKALLALFESCTATGTGSVEDGLVDLIGEVQARLPTGTAITLMIPPTRHAR